MHPIFVRKVFDPLVDVISGRYTCKAYSELMETQWLSEDELVAYQEKKIRQLIRHAYECVPYYRNLFKENAFTPSDIKSLSDLEKIPISDKNTIKNSNGYPDCMFSQSHSGRRVTFGRTGGTTGEPLILAKDVNTRSYTWAAYWRWLSWMGLNRGDKSATIWGQPVIHRSFLQRYESRFLEVLGNNFSLNAFDLSPKNLQDFVVQLQQKKPKHLHGYASSIFAFAQYILENDVELPDMNISTTAEKLDDYQRSVIEQAFGERIFDQYGCGECGSLAFECEAHQGLHITSEHAIVECVRNSNDIHPNHNVGEAIITDLDNYYMPIIRYKNGDLVELNDDVCSCGRNHPLIKNVGGRISDILYTAQKHPVHQDYFTHLLNESGYYNKYNIKKYQVIQESFDNIIWKIVCEDIPEKEIEKIIRRVKEGFDGTYVNIQFVDDIPNEPSGKYRYVKSNIGQKYGPNVR
jgi:phenylacetate-CoA ligase